MGSIVKLDGIVVESRNVNNTLALCGDNLIHVWLTASGSERAGVQ